MTDSIHQLLSLPPRHLDGLRVDAHDCLRDVGMPMIASSTTGAVSNGLRGISSPLRVGAVRMTVQESVRDLSRGNAGINRYGEVWNDATLTCGRTGGHEG